VKVVAVAVTRHVRWLIGCAHTLNICLKFHRQFPHTESRERQNSQCGNAVVGLNEFISAFSTFTFRYQRKSAHNVVNNC
jgi:hypothetical protein